MTDVYRDTDERYRNDPAFHAAVTSLEVAAAEHGFTPGELKQIAFKAALNLEMRARPLMYVTKRTQKGRVPTFATPEEYEAAYPGSKAPRGVWQRPVAIVVPVGEVAGHLKDGTPVYFGRTP